MISCPIIGRSFRKTKRRKDASSCPRTRERRCRMAARLRSGPCRPPPKATASIFASGHRVQRVIRNRAGEIIGVEADTAKGKKVRFFARKAVVFCTGGFTHNVELRKNYLSAPVYGGCAARSNEGDFVYVASALGAQLRNMNYAWMCPIVFEKAIAKDPGLIGTFSPSGDSMIYVSKEGRRVANEKLAYNEMAQVFFQMGRSARRVSEPDADRDLGPTQPGSQRQRRIWTLHRSSRQGRCACDQRRHARRLERARSRSAWPATRRSPAA